MDSLDKAIINRLQKGLPICERPYLAVAEELACEGSELIERIDNMLVGGLLSRFGPMFDANCFGGAFTLAAMAVPQERFEQVADIVNGFEQVAHNYERNHHFNMWFVIAAEAQNQIEQVIAQIEQQTALEVLNLPKQHEFFVGLYLPV